MTKQLINNALDKILYKGKYAKKDIYSHNKEDIKCDSCGEHIGSGFGYYHNKQNKYKCSECAEKHITSGYNLKGWVMR